MKPEILMPKLSSFGHWDFLRPSSFVIRWSLAIGHELVSREKSLGQSLRQKFSITFPSSASPSPSPSATPPAPAPIPPLSAPNSGSKTFATQSSSPSPPIPCSKPARDSFLSPALHFPSPPDPSAV